VALSITDPRAGNLDLWAYETTGGIPARLTTHPGVDGGPTWSPDGKRMAFSSIRAGHTGIYSLEASGGSEPHPVLTTQGGDYPTDWSPDGRFILERHMDAQSNLELWIVPVDDPGKHAPLVRGAFGASHGRFSPDGRFVAYQANETGRWEISVTAFPGPGGTWRVSSEGGTEPVWSRDGKELFYLAADGHLMAVPVRLAPTFDAGSPKPLFLLRRREPVSAIDLYDYDVAPDGRRFLVNVSTETASPPLTVVLDWAGEPRHGSRLP
jgi:Tol biopolymer transport system component